MTLKHRIIPILLTDGQGNCVKPVRFQRPYRKVGSLMQYIKMMERRNVDELIVIDIEATNEGRLIDCDKIKEYTKELFCPLTLGGGIRNLDDINKLLQSGADKVCIKTNHKIINEASQKFGVQCIVGIIDYTGKLNIGLEAKLLCKNGVGEILFTNCQLDGAMIGYDYDSIMFVSKNSSVPVIANGGCGSLEDMKWAIESGASAVAAGSMFLFTDTTPRDCAEYLNSVGIGVRL